MQFALRAKTDGAMEGTALFALGLTLFAGLSTGLGSLVILLARRPKATLLAFSLGFSGGVMVYVSLAELMPQAVDAVGEHLGEKPGGFLAVGCFLGGILLSAAIDRLVPQPLNPHEAVSLDDMGEMRRGEGPSAEEGKRSALSRLGLLTALAIGIHNFPEGVATFAVAMSDASLGVSIAVAIAIHNIPEGISVAVPVYFATGSRRKAFLLSFATGLAEPVGALLAYLVLMPVLHGALIGGMLAAVAGIMVFISFDELLPAAREYDRGHVATVGVLLGMSVMAISLLLL
jgi:ZIP family zinc transporter